MRAAVWILVLGVWLGGLAKGQDDHPQHSSHVEEPFHHLHHHDEHSPGHYEEPSFEYIRPYVSHGRGEHGAHGHSGHTSLEGYPFAHGLRTEIDFVERALEFDLVRSSNADGDTDEWEFETELVWAINDHMIFIIGAPLISLDPVIAPNTTGIGDLELGVQFLAFGGDRDLFFVALNATVPTGDVDRDLGIGHTTLEPTALWLHDFGKGRYFQSRFGWQVPVSTADVASEFRYDVGLYHCLLRTTNASRFQFLTPLLEANGTTQLHGTGHGDTALDLTAGLRWVVRERDEVGIGWSFPVTGSQNFDDQFILSYRLHW